MSGAINRAVIVGRLTKDAEIKKTSSGKSVCSFTVACDRPGKNEDGSHTADFINCVAWNQKADFLGTYGRKGSLIGIDGTIQTRHYTNQATGQEVFITEILAGSVQLFSQKTNANGSDTPRSSTSYTKDDISRAIANDPDDPYFGNKAAEEKNDKPAYQQQSADDVKWGYGDGQDSDAIINADDLPF